MQQDELRNPAFFHTTNKRHVGIWSDIARSKRSTASSQFPPPFAVSKARQSPLAVLAVRIGILITRKLDHLKFPATEINWIPAINQILFDWIQSAIRPANWWLILSIPTLILETEQCKPKKNEREMNWNAHKKGKQSNNSNHNEKQNVDKKLTGCHSKPVNEKYRHSLQDRTRSLQGHNYKT